MLNLVRRFLAVAIVQAGLGLLTGIIVARSLGPAGRGELAAVIVPLSLLPYVLSLGLTTFTSRTLAAGADLKEIVGTTGTVAAVVGLLAIGPCILLLHGFAGQNRSAQTVLVIGLALLPVSLVAGVLGDAGLGLQQWTRVSVQRLFPPVTVLVGYGILLLVGAMSAASAAAVTLAAGLLSVAPFLPLARRAWPVRFSAERAKQAFRFSGFAWLIQTSQLMNHRLDQLMMVPLVSRRELGLYAIAVTLSGVTNLLSGSIGTVLYPKLAARENIDLARIVRHGLAGATVSGVLCAAIAPLFLPLAFGSSFSGAVPMLLLLLVANIPLAGASILVTAYTSRPRIALASMSELAANAVTVGGLLLVLPGMGGVGAALVSLIAYLVNFAWLLVMARRDYGGRWRDYLVLAKDDIAEFGSSLVQVGRALNQ